MGQTITLTVSLGERETELLRGISQQLVWLQSFVAECVAEGGGVTLPQGAGMATPTQETAVPATQKETTKSPTKAGATNAQGRRAGTEEATTTTTAPASVAQSAPTQTTPETDAITYDAIADLMRQYMARYGRDAVAELFRAERLSSLRDLKPEQYAPFAHEVRTQLNAPANGSHTA